MEKLLVLYTEYAPYLHACLLKFTNLYDYEVHVVRYPLDKNAPFQFQETDSIRFYDRSLLVKNDILDLYLKLAPKCVIVAGWIDKEYIDVAGKIVRWGKMVIGVIDNQWTGTLRQRIFIKIGRYFIRKHFSVIWVPGIVQYEYMRRSGIPPDMIMTGYYSADSDLFFSRYRKLEMVPKKFVYVGRLLDIKGTKTLFDAIELVNARGVRDWQFLIIGNGTYEQEAMGIERKYSNVIYKPFMQPEQLIKETAGGGVFILPSNYDAWGVVVHEYAIMGFPLILSSMVGSRFYFVTPGYNGFVFQAGNAGSLANEILKTVKLDDSILVKMSDRSHEIGKTINTEAWSNRLYESIQYYNRKSCVE